MNHVTIAAALAASTLAAPAIAEVRPTAIYAYETAENYCPAGLQPVTINGIVCCGTPNQSLTYRQVMTHPVVQRHVVQRRVVRHKPVGIPLKGNDVYVPVSKGID